ncbi:hypothetical protein HOY80DRAFT_948308 [Tuber brumale]|nr:hypothetical protein HOY80DRAFT_948308 [Tuber brumale]
MKLKTTLPLMPSSYVGFFLSLSLSLPGRALEGHDGQWFYVWMRVFSAPAIPPASRVAFTATKRKVNSEIRLPEHGSVGRFVMGPHSATKRIAKL